MPLNDWFTGRYAIARQELMARLTEAPDPLFIRMGPELVYWHHGRRRSTVLMTDAYDRAKSVNHVPAAIHLALRGRIGVALTQGEVALLRDLDADVVAAKRHLRGPENAMLNACHDFLERALKEETVGAEAMATLAETTLVPMHEVIRLGTRVYLEALHEAVQGWSRDWDEATWGRLLVVVCAGHAPRYKESTRTYFCRLLGETHGLGAKGEERVVYAEGAETEEEALRLGAEHLLNRELGRFFMKSSVALQEDVLGDATEAILDDLL
ncbi:MAG: hypothetical protein CMN30_29840 [Sandaracinus sp.]|nr:hypothetical protein [Sandaracinus sp.]|tara:strand:- start:414 stop:1217 length:804 start_codon:yes stop_codon:yes gene_type:complete